MGRLITVFYSWQSDRTAKLNRSFIQAALERALKEASRKLANVDFALDKDTARREGTPDITETIFEKIRESDMFVADVTIIGHVFDGDDSSLLGRIKRIFKPGTAMRPTANPNVLAELGFAAGNIEWQRVICVANTHFGDLATLPFDIRNRRVIGYHFDGTESSREEVRTQLANILRSRILEIVAAGIKDSPARQQSRIIAQRLREAGALLHFFINDYCSKRKLDGDTLAQRILYGTAADAAEAAAALANAIIADQQFLGHDHSLDGRTTLARPSTILIHSLATASKTISVVIERLVTYLSPSDVSALLLCERVFGNTAAKVSYHQDDAYREEVHVEALPDGQSREFLTATFKQLHVLNMLAQHHEANGRIAES